jgi:transposase InsO family protein
VLECLAELFIIHGTPDYLRSDNGPEFVAEILRGWLQRLGVKTLFIEPGSPWENGYIESFNGKLRYEFLDGEIFDTVLEARVVTETWMREYQHRKHTNLFSSPMPEESNPTLTLAQPPGAGQEAFVC